MIYLRFCLEHHYLYLAIDRLTAHVIENFFGQNRLKCKRKNSYQHVMHFFIKGALDFELVQEFDLGDKINERDNVGGTRYDETKWIIKFCCNFDVFEFVNTMFQYGTESSIDWKVAKKVFEYMEILKKFHEDLIKNDAYQQFDHSK